MVLLLPFVAVVGVAAASGGFNATSFGWTALAFAWIVIVAVALDETRVGILRRRVGHRGGRCGLPLHIRLGGVVRVGRLPP